MAVFSLNKLNCFIVFEAVMMEFARAAPSSFLLVRRSVFVSLLTVCPVALPGSCIGPGGYSVASLVFSALLLTPLQSETFSVSLPNLGLHVLPPHHSGSSLQPWPWCQQEV